jgi:hypothetical protein
MHPQDTSFLVNGFKPTVALQDPATTMAKVQAVRNAQQQNQIGQQQLQEGQLAIQDKQRQINQNLAINDAYSKAFSIDPNTGKQTIDNEALTKAVVGAGYGSAVPGILEGITKTQKAQADLAESRGKVETQQLDVGGGIGASVLKANGDPGLFNTLATDAINSGAIDQQHVPAIKAILAQIGQAQQQDPTGAAARKMVTQASQVLVSHSPVYSKQAAEDAAAAAKTTEAATGAATAAAKLPGEQASSDAAVLKNAAGSLSNATDQADYTAKLRALPASMANTFPAKFNPATDRAAINRIGMTPEEQTKADAEAATLSQTKTRDTQTALNENTRNRIAGGELNIKQKTFDAQYGSAATTATAIAAGKIDPQTVRAELRKNPGLLNQVLAVDPKFDEGNIDNRYTALKEFGNTSVTKAGGQSLALNTMIHHADLYMEAGDAMKNFTFKPGNTAYNEISSMMGHAPPQNAAVIARFLAGETGKVATGGVPAEGEINGILKTLSTSSSPEQISDAGKTLLQVAAGRATPLMELAKKNKIDNIVQVLGPDAQSILKRRGFDPDTMKPAAMLTPADAQGYLKKAGWTAGAPTQAQKEAAAALAKKDGRNF